MFHSGRIYKKRLHPEGNKETTIIRRKNGINETSTLNWMNKAIYSNLFRYYILSNKNFSHSFQIYK